MSAADKKMHDMWELINTPEFQHTLSWIGGGVTAIAGGIWALVRFFVERRPSAARRDPSQQAKSDSSTVIIQPGWNHINTALLLFIILGMLMLFISVVIIPNIPIQRVSEDDGVDIDGTVTVGGDVVGGDKVTVEAPEPVLVPFAEELILGERDAGASHGLILETGFIGLGGRSSSYWAEIKIKSGGQDVVSQTVTPGESFTITAGGDLPAKEVTVKDIYINITVPNMTMDDVEKLGIAGNFLLERRVVFIISGEETQR